MTVPFTFATSTNPIPLSNLDANFAALGNASGVTYTPPFTGGVAETVSDKLAQTVSVKDFGALGDGTGATPASTGHDVTNESWNTWNWTAFKTNAAYSPYYVGGVFTPPKAKPFDNNDTWDYIGISLALWQDLAVYIPEGDYRINIDNNRGAYTGLIMMKGQEKPVFGAGAYKSIITTTETDSFFAANFHGTANKYQLLTLYRTSAVPSVWRDLVFSGPYDFGAANNNLTLIYATNTNGVSYENNWMTSASRGIYQDSSSGDCRCHMITTEYLFRSSIETDSTCDITIEFCDIWASASLSIQQGVILGREGRVTNCKFVDFNGPSFTAVRGVFANNYITTTTASSYVVKFTDTCTIIGNQFDVESAGPSLVVYENASVIGNIFKQTAPHPCLNLGDETSATNITVSGNTFVKTDSTVDPQNYAITAETVSGYFNAAASSVLITSNTFQGRANTAFGAATFIANSINGNVSSAYESNHTNTIDTTITNTGAGKIVNETDIAGKNVLNGTGTGSSFNVTVGSSLIGYNGGTARDQERLILISAFTSAAHQAGSGYALYTNDYNGNRVLIATLGTHCSGGTISFSASGANVVVTITNSTDATTDYVVNAVPLI